MNYDAFISYRHAPLDMEIAKKVHTGLETYKIPKAVRKKTGKAKMGRVFRDQEELPIGSDLGDNISGALAGSEYLIVICSPRTPDSYWVCKEIDTFIKLHDRDHILAVLIEGEPDESFPPQLLTDENGEPVMDDSKCIYEKNDRGEFILDDEGNKKLTKDSPLPVPLLEETSAKPEPLLEYTIFFQAKDAKIIEHAFKKYIEDHDKKLSRNKDRSERTNIKDMIKKFKDKMSEVNADNPEKHHNRGEQSL